MLRRTAITFARGRLQRSHRRRAAVPARAAADWEGPRQWPDNDLLPLLRDRLLGTYSPLLADTTATLLFTAGGMANWTGRDRPRAGGCQARRAGQPDHHGPSVAARPRRGRRRHAQRYRGFLAGDLTVRGNLALAFSWTACSPVDRAITRTPAPPSRRIETFT